MSVRRKRRARALLAWLTANHCQWCRITVGDFIKCVMLHDGAMRRGDGKGTP